MSDVAYINGSTRPGAARLLDHPHTRLVGATLRWKRYRSWTMPAPAGRCELCGAEFTEGGAPGPNSGYSVVGGGPAGQDDYRWICAVCYELQRDDYCWTVLDTCDNPTEPPALLDAAFGWIARRLDSEVQEPVD